MDSTKTADANSYKIIFFIFISFKFFCNILQMNVIFIIFKTKIIKLNFSCLQNSSSYACKDTEGYLPSYTGILFTLILKFPVLIRRSGLKIMVSLGHGNLCSHWKYFHECLTTWEKCLMIIYKNFKMQKYIVEHIFNFVFLKILEDGRKNYS